MIVKTVKVSDKGQISIPFDIRQLAGIEKGDELVVTEKEGKILLEKADRVSKKISDDFRDILKISENSLKEIWDSKEDDIWSSYLTK